jgi:hypothetical protein
MEAINKVINHSTPENIFPKQYRTSYNFIRTWLRKLWTVLLYERIRITRQFYCHSASSCKRMIKPPSIWEVSSLHQPLYDLSCQEDIYPAMVQLICTGKQNKDFCQQTIVLLCSYFKTAKKPNSKSIHLLTRVFTEFRRNGIPYVFFHFRIFRILYGIIENSAEFLKVKRNSLSRN